MGDDQIKQLIKEVAEQKKILHSIRRSMRFNAVMNVLRLLFIIVPLVIAIIFLPTLINQAKTSFEAALGPDILPKGLNVDDIQQFLQK